MTVDRKKIQRDFEFIRDNLFSRWDRKKEWKLKIIKNGPIGGKFDAKIRRIRINETALGNILSSTMLIHEICHCYSDYHGKRFFQCMRKKAQKARVLNLPEIAREIEEDVRLYETTERTPVSFQRDVYNNIEDAVLDVPQISYYNLIRNLAYERFMYPKELEAKCKRIKEVFKGAEKSIREIKKARIMMKD